MPERAAMQRPSLLWLFLLQLLFWAAATGLAGDGRESWHNPAALHEHGSGAAALLSYEQVRPLRHTENPLLRDAPGRLPAWVPEVFAVLFPCAALLYCFICILAPRVASSPTLHPLAPRAPPRSSFPG